MLSRLKNILHDRNLDNIYYLNYEVNNVLNPQDTPSSKVQHLNFIRLIEGTQNPILPINAFKLEREFGSFKFYRLNNNWVNQFASWKKAALGPNSFKKQVYRWERISSLTGKRPLIRFEDSFTLAMENKENSFLNNPGFTLNLVNVAGDNNNFTAVLLEGYMIKDKVIYDPTWQVNAWILDHPYGTDIFESVWNPAIFISKGMGNVSVLDVNFISKIGRGALKDFFSVRIEEPRMGNK
jgi:hypothetical protein